MKLTEYSVKKRVAVGVMVLAFVVLGLYGLARLPVNFLPDITYPLIKIHIWWPGATPEEIDLQLADPIERQMATVDGLDYLESSSIEGMYTLQANFKYGVNVDVAYQDALAAMARVARQLPKDIDPPVVIKADPSLQPVAQLTIRSQEIDLTKLRTWTENWLQVQLLTVPGVAGTEIVGGMKREIRIHVDPIALEKYGLALATVVKRLGQENLEQFGGRVTEGRREFISRTVGDYGSLEEIRNILLAGNGPAKVYLRDVADVEDAHADVRIITRLGGEPCIKLSVMKQADANTVEVARAVSRKIDQLAPSFPNDVRIGMVENQADYVQAALDGVRNTALEAMVLVILTVFLFLGSWRQVLVMVLALPITICINFGLMKLGGFSLNIFSLSGLVVAIAVALDNSIVVLENISRLKAASPDAPIEQSVIQGTAQVGQALVAATVSFLALFLPFLLVPGLTSLLFKELIFVVSGIMVLSLIMAVTVTPLFSVVFLSAQVHQGSSRFESFFERLRDLYGLSLDRVMHHRRLIFAGAAALLLAAILTSGLVGSEFLPRMDDGRVMVKVKLPTGASLAQTDQVLKQIEAKLAGDPLVESMFTLTGGKVWGLYTYEIANEGEIDIQMIPREKRKVATAEYVKKIRPLVAQVQVPDGKVAVSQMKVKGLRSLGEADVDIQIRGQDIYKLFDMARLLSETMNGLKHFTNVYISMDLNKPEYQVRIDRPRATELGVTVSDVATSLKSLITGAIATKYKDGDKQYDIRVVVPEKNVTSRRAVEDMPLLPVAGGYLKVRDVANVVPAVGPVEIVRYNQVKQVIIRGDAAGVSVGQALGELKAAAKKIDLPPGYEIGYGGQAQMMGDMQRDVIMILAFAVFFAFVVLAVQFNSLRIPGLILGSLPFCVAGIILLLAATRLPFGATVLIGALVVIAATINEGVLLLTLAEEIRRTQGRTPAEVVIEAAKIRFRPRLMISLMIITGMIPLALNLEAGGEMLQPMAVAAIGGLLTVIVVSLYLLPVLYAAVAEHARGQGITEMLKRLPARWLRRRGSAEK